MRLKKIIALKQEIKNIQEFLCEDIEFGIYDTISELKTEGAGEHVLLIASCDETIAIGKELGVATMAYANPDFPNQTYAGVDMIVEGFEEVDIDFLEKVWERYHHIPWTILETERCIVKELCLENLDGLFELYADEEISKYTESLYPYEEEKEFQRAYIENMYRYFGYGMWLVFSKENGKIIGRAGLEHREYNGEVELELGYLIGVKYQGKGYATEVCQAIIEYARENAGFGRINTVIEEGNEASIILCKKLGFEHMEDYELDGKIMHRFIKKFVV